jgi:hypothetical protein
LQPREVLRSFGHKEMFDSLNQKGSVKAV